MGLNILVTGGAGYIGTHTCLELIEAGYDVVILDNLTNSSIKAVKRIENISGKTIKFIQGDICDTKVLSDTFKNNDIYGIIHFGGLKAVGESVQYPLKYFINNVKGSINLLEQTEIFNIKRFIFSSSATVYGDFSVPPFREDAKLGATNPYGRTKFMVEQIINDISQANDKFKAITLRYFNPVGAHQSGLIGEDPLGIPNNLMPFIMQVAIGKRPYLQVFGNDYPTKDGTCIRDYIHVVDLAKGHVAALNAIDNISGSEVINLGTGHGASVLEVVNAVSKAVDKKVEYRIVDRRLGDVAISVADPTYSKKILNWEASYNLDDMCRDSWKWQKSNPNGYE
jgi:UDP-glucose 4-epimerase